MESLESLELERQSIVKKNMIRTLIGVGAIVLFLIIGVIIDFLAITVLGVVVLIILLVINGSLKSKYRKEFKDKIVRQLIKEELGSEAFYNPNGGISISEIDSIKCTKVPDRYTMNDYISAKYNDVQYEMCDCHFEERKVTYDSKGNRVVKYVTFFKGRAIKIDFKRDLNIVLKLVNQGPIGFDTEGLTKFETEVIDFNKRFKCYVDEQENGFYILTPLFIQKLLQLESMFRGGLVLAFKHNNLYILINNGNDALEVSFRKPLNGEQFERFRGEILLPSAIINELRIDDDKFNRDIK